MEALLCFLLPLAFCGADRGIGGLVNRWFVIIPLLAGAIALKLAGFGFVGLIAAVWLFYRSIPWEVGGTITPRGPLQIAGSFLRNCLPMAAVPMGHVWFDVPLKAALPFSIYAVFATGLAIAYARAVDDLASRGLGESGEINDNLEMIRGFLFGLGAVWAMTGY